MTGNFDEIALLERIGRWVLYVTIDSDANGQWGADLSATGFYVCAPITAIMSFSRSDHLVVSRLRIVQNGYSPRFSTSVLASSLRSFMFIRQRRQVHFLLIQPWNIACHFPPSPTHAGFFSSISFCYIVSFDWVLRLCVCSELVVLLQVPDVRTLNVEPTCTVASVALPWPLQSCYDTTLTFLTLSRKPRDHCLLSADWTIRFDLNSMGTKGLSQRIRVTSSLRVAPALPHATFTLRNGPSIAIKASYASPMSTPVVSFCSLCSLALV